MKINDILDLIPSDEIDVTLDERQPFPDYELEIQWKEWRWNDARTERLHIHDDQGICINPGSYLDKEGNLDNAALLKDAIAKIESILHNEDRVGNIEILG